MGDQISLWHMSLVRQPGYFIEISLTKQWPIVTHHPPVLYIHLIVCVDVES